MNAEPIMRVNGTAPAPELQLVVEAQRGESEACEELARRYRRPAYYLALQLLGDPELARDVAQDAMLRFFGSLARFDPDRPVEPWLFRIVHNRVRDLRRRRRVRRSESLETAVEGGRLVVTDPGPGPEALTRRAELQRRVWGALGRLSDSDREILVLRDYQDLAYAEIADVLGIPKGTVMSRLHRARRRLREILLAEEGPRGAAPPAVGGSHG